jgi:nuclear cap-binding protein subunit 2
MSHLYKVPQAETGYSRKNWHGTAEEYHHALATSTTVYVGNLSFFTREEQIWELFSKVGEVSRIVMGLNKYELTPCGFCFVEYYTHEAAADCVNYVSGTKLDERVIRADWDTGFVEGRQYGRGSSGGQVRDEFRDYFDPERGDKQQKANFPLRDAQPAPYRHTPSKDSSHESHRYDGPHTPHNRNDHHAQHTPRNFPPSDERQGDRDRYEESRGRGYDDRFSSRDYRDHRDRYDDHRRDSRDFHRDHHDNRGKRSRSDFEQRSAPPEPMVDEFGRDIPIAKRSKGPERR